MKRVFAALVTLIFLFNMMGYYFVFSIRQDLIRGEVQTLARAGYFKGSCLVLSISDPLFNRDFRRIGKDEFMYRENLYDIISETKTGNVTVFHCINDKTEEKLLAGFHRSSELALDQNNPGKAKQAQSLIRHLITIALIEIHLFHTAQYPSEIKYYSQSYPLQISLQGGFFHPPKIS